MICAIYFRPICGLLRNRATNFVSERSIFLLSKQKRRSTERKKESQKRNTKHNGPRINDEDQSNLPNFELFKSLKASSRCSQQNRNPPESQSSESVGTDELIPHLYIDNSTKNKISQSESKQKKNGMSFDPKLLSLASPAIEIPLVFKAKLGPAVRYLVNKDSQNWKLALNQIEISGGFHDIDEKDIRKLVYVIPKSQLVFVFPIIERLLREAGKQLSPKIMNTYLKSLIAGGSLSDERLQLMESYVSEMKFTAFKKRLSRETYEILAEAYGKSKKIDQMEMIINEMKSHGLRPSFNIYKSVLNTCVYKTRDHKQAVQVFDSMKFIAGNMAPGLFQYQDIIVSYVNNNDIERALDLYEEMKGKNIQVNQRILVALAKGCMTRASLRFQSWNFIFKIYESGWEPAVFTLEYMIYLAAKDGDLSLSRALYWHLYRSDSASPRSFGFLMMAYANCNLFQNLDNYTVPSIMHHGPGRNFRANMIEKANFLSCTATFKSTVPFLPLKSLMDSNQILSESNAVLAHAILANPTFVTLDSITNFLEAAAKSGSLCDFIDRYNQFTFFDEVGVPGTRIESTHNPHIDSVDNATKIEALGLNSRSDVQFPSLSKRTKYLIPTQSIHESFQVKFRRTTDIFCIALEAAAKHRDFEYSQKIWLERGLYRKSEFFRRMTQKEKKKSDFKFATKLVKCLAHMKLLDDALAILLSTEFQFKWTWKELNSLYRAAVEVGHEKVAAVVRGVARRAQKKYEGKIKHQEFKMYVSRQH